MNDAKSYHDLINSTSKNGHNFATLDMKIANSLWRIMPRDLKRQVSIWDSLQEKTYNKMLNGRQLAWIIFDHFTMPEVTVRMFRLQDLMNLKLRDDSLAQYNLEWDEMLAGMQEIPAEDVMDALYSTQIQRSTECKNIWDLYNYDITFKQSKPSYQNLKNGEHVPGEENKREVEESNRDE